MFINLFRGLAVVALLGLGQATLRADLLHDNGPYITHPNAAHTTLGTVNVSQLQNTTLGHTTLGTSVHPVFRLADDFTIAAGQWWTLTGFNVFSYSTNFPTAPTGANARIWLGDPGAGGVLVYDGSATNTLVSSTFDALRISETGDPAAPPFTNTQRHVFNTLIGLPNVQLGAGQYWLDWQINPTAGAASVFAPPVTILGQPVTAANGFARQLNTTTGVWTGQLAHGNGNAYDLPFLLQGSAIPEPGSLTLLALGAIGLVSRRRR